MAFSNGDAKKEIAEIISGISSDERPVSSPKKAFQIVAIYPVIMILTAILMWFAYYVSLIQAGDNSGLGWKFYLARFRVWRMDIYRGDSCCSNILHTHKLFYCTGISIYT
jgi:hypothetical protein